MIKGCTYLPVNVHICTFTITYEFYKLLPLMNKYITQNIYSIVCYTLVNVMCSPQTGD